MMRKVRLDRYPWILLAVIAFVGCTSEFNGMVVAIDDSSTPTATRFAQQAEVPTPTFTVSVTERPIATIAQTPIPTATAVDNHSAAREFVAAMQQAVSSDDADLLASWLRFPLRVYDGDTQIQITSAEAFVSRFNVVVNQEVRAAILQQPPDELFYNWQGYMIGSGQIWFDRTGNDSNAHPFVITAINNYVPTGSTLTQTPTPPSLPMFSDFHGTWKVQRVIHSRAFTADFDDPASGYIGQTLLLDEDSVSYWDGACNVEGVTIRQEIAWRYFWDWFRLDLGANDVETHYTHFIDVTCDDSQLLTIPAFDDGSLMLTHGQGNFLILRQTTSSSK